MNEQEVREFEENIVKGANIAFQRLVNQKKKEDGELVFSFWLYRKRNLGSWAKYVNILRHFS